MHAEAATSTICRQAGRRAGRQAGGGQAGRQAGGQAGCQARRWRGLAGCQPQLPALAASTHPPARPPTTQHLPTQPNPPHPPTGSTRHRHPPAAAPPPASAGCWARRHAHSAGWLQMGRMQARRGQGRRGQAGCVPGGNASLGPRRQLARDGWQGAGSMVPSLPPAACAMTTQGMSRTSGLTQSLSHMQTMHAPRSARPVPQPGGAAPELGPLATMGV